MEMTGPQERAMRALIMLRRGETISDLDEAIRKVVEAVGRCGKKGEITLKITIRPAAKGCTDSIQITDEVIAKPPKPDTVDTFAFVDPRNHQITDRHPDQLEIEFGEMPANTQDVPIDIGQ